MITTELHMNDMHDAATSSRFKKVVKDLTLEINFMGDDRYEFRKSYDHFKRLRFLMTEPLGAVDDARLYGCCADTLMYYVLMRFDT